MGVVDKGVGGRVVNPEVFPPAQPAPLLPVRRQRHHHAAGDGQHRHMLAGPVVPLVLVPVLDEDVQRRVPAVSVAVEVIVAAALIAVPPAAGDSFGRVAREGEDPGVAAVLLAAIALVVGPQLREEPEQLVPGFTAGDLAVAHPVVEPVELQAGLTGFDRRGRRRSGRLGNDRPFRFGSEVGAAGDDQEQEAQRRNRPGGRHRQAWGPRSLASKTSRDFWTVSSSRILSPSQAWKILAVS